jgi:5'-methylthioadenosine nucleosidase
MISNVVIAIAMEAEASPFVNHLNLQPDTSFFPTQTPFHAFTGKHGNCNLTVVTNGKDVVHDTGVDNVGTVPVSHAIELVFICSSLQSKILTILFVTGSCGHLFDVSVTVFDAHLYLSLLSYNLTIF